MAIKDDITEIKVAVGKIEEHLKDMNGKLVKAEEHINKDCPGYRDGIKNKIDCVKGDINKLKSFQLKVMTGVGIVLGFLMFFKDKILSIF